MTEESICSDCIQESFLSSFIRQNGTQDECSFCNGIGKTIGFDDAIDLILDGIEFIYDDPVNGLGWVDGDWVEGDGSVLDTYDLLVDEYGMGGSPAFEALLARLPCHSWCKKNFYGPDESTEKYFTWEYFVRQVKHKTRYFFMNDGYKMEYEQFRFDKPYRILAELLSTFERTGLFSILPKGLTIYRARKETVRGQYSTAKSLGAPKPENCIYSNRMSPAGISVFYASEDTETCVSETENRGGLYAVGTWQLQEEITVLDLTSTFTWSNGSYYYPDLPSVFDPARRDNYHDFLFILKFATDLSKIVAKDGTENIDYVPTQVVTEYLRVTKSDREVRGICFYSSINGRKNYCLFYDYNDCGDTNKIRLTSVLDVEK